MFWKQSINFIIASSLFILPLSGIIAQSNENKFYIDRLHSSVRFNVDYLEIMELDGRVDDYFSSLQIDTARNSISDLYVLLKTSSLNTAMINRDKDLLSERYLDTKKYPIITFQSNNFYSRNDSLFCTGTLSIKNVSKKIEIAYTQSYLSESSSRNLLIIKTNPIVISRSDFSIGNVVKTSFDKIFLGDQIRITINALFRSIRPRELALIDSNQTGIINIDQLIGAYTSETGTSYYVEKYDGKPFWSLPNAGVFRELIPSSIKNRFIVSDIGYALDFSIENGITQSVLYRRGGESDSSKWQLMIRVP